MKAVIVGVMCLAVSGAYAALEVANSSFEADVLDPGTRTVAITDWYNRSAYCWATEETYDTERYPATPYGSNWAELGRESWVYQQIGTWEENLELRISLLTGSVVGQDYQGFYVSLWAGGDPAQAADENIFPDTTLTTAVGATQIAISDLILPEAVLSDTMGNYGYWGNATTAEVDVTLSTGTGYTEGDPLWLLIQAAGRKRVLVDNVAVTVIPEPGTLGLLMLGAVGLFRRRR